MLSPRTKSTVSGSSDRSQTSGTARINSPFEYQSFHIITKLLKNRGVVVCCTKFLHSDADERVDVEVVMREKGWVGTCWGQTSEGSDGRYGCR